MSDESPEGRERGRLAEFLERGWILFPQDSSLRRWASAVRARALATVEDEALRRRWLRCDGTWFAGVHALDNDAEGAVPAAGVPALEGEALRFLRRRIGLPPLDRAQVSVVYPGYPRQEREESDAAFGYRIRRHAAHVDGFERIMPGRRRRLSECHAFVLGLPLAETDAAASPLSVWEGSHEVFRAALRERFAGAEPGRWTRIDCTEAYVAARRACFRACRRVSVAAGPGEAYLLHRLALHGVAPWGAPDGAAPRAVAYFRPAMTGADLPRRWLDDP